MLIWIPLKITRCTSTCMTVTYQGNRALTWGDLHWSPWLFSVRMPPTPTSFLWWQGWGQCGRDTVGSG